MPYKGWVELSFQLGSGPVVPVPFLIVGNEVKVPIVGFNVMKRLLEVMGPVAFIQELMDSLGLNEEKAEATVKIIEAAESDSLADVKSAKKRVVVAAGQVLQKRMGLRIVLGALCVGAVVGLSLAIALPATQAAEQVSSQDHSQT